MKGLIVLGLALLLIAAGVWAAPKIRAKLLAARDKAKAVEETVQAAAGQIRDEVQ